MENTHELTHEGRRFQAQDPASVAELDEIPAEIQQPESQEADTGQCIVGLLYDADPL